MNKALASFTMLAALAGVASAQQIGTRAQLDSILAGGSYVTDDFLAYNIGSGSAVGMGVSAFNSTTIVNGQGPGLVNPGVEYDSANGTTTLQWDGVNYYGSLTQEILSNSQGLNINYSTAVQAMGFDFRAFQGYPDTFTANVYDGNTLLGTYSVATPTDGSTQFFGWYNAAGITAVDITDSTHSWSPLIQNHTFGVTAAPEPASMAALALGAIALLRRRRR